MKPNEVTKRNEQQTLQTVYNPAKTLLKPKFNFGDYVRMSKFKGTFFKEYEPNWTAEIFQ